MGFEVSIIDAASPYYVELCPIEYPVIGDELRLSMLAVKTPQRANKISSRRDDSPSVNRAETIASRILRNDNISHVCKLSVITINCVVLDFESNIGRGFMTRIDKHDSKMNTLIFRQLLCKLSTDWRDPCPLGSLQSILSFDNAPNSNDYKKESGESYAEMRLGNIFLKISHGAFAWVFFAAGLTF